MFILRYGFFLLILKWKLELDCKIVILEFYEKINGNRNKYIISFMLSRIYKEYVTAKLNHQSIVLSIKLYTKILAFLIPLSIRRINLK